MFYPSGKSFVGPVVDEDTGDETRVIYDREGVEVERSGFPAVMNGMGGERPVAFIAPARRPIP